MFFIMHLIACASLFVLSNLFVAVMGRQMSGVVCVLLMQ